MEALMIDICPLCQHEASLWSSGRFALCAIHCDDCGDYEATRSALRALARSPQFRIDRCRQFVRDAQGKQGVMPRFVMLPRLTMLMVKV